VKLRRRQVAKTLGYDGQRHDHSGCGVSQRLISVANAALERADGSIQVIVCGASRSPAGDDVEEDRDCVESRVEVGWVGEEPLEEDCVGDVDVAASVDGVDYPLDLGADCSRSACEMRGGEGGLQYTTFSIEFESRSSQNFTRERSWGVRGTERGSHCLQSGDGDQPRSKAWLFRRSLHKTTLEGSSVESCPSAIVWVRFRLRGPPCLVFFPRMTWLRMVLRCSAPSRPWESVAMKTSPLASGAGEYQQGSREKFALDLPPGPCLRVIVAATCLAGTRG
jgi:hypothetical protein